LVGWWLTYPSEKYEFVSWDDYSQYMESHKIPWFHDWLVIDIPTPLKNMTASVGMDGTSQSMESHKIHVSNHQAAIFDTKRNLDALQNKSHSRTHAHAYTHIGSCWIILVV